jgi:hypothetical protein
MSFKRPITIRAYGLKSADKSPNESPKAWKFEGFVPNTTKGEIEYKIIHDMVAQQELTFTQNLQTKIFVLPDGPVTINGCKLSVTTNGGTANSSLA